jgi:hypothetical protein
MKISFYNEWKETTMQPGGAFPIRLIEIYFDIHPSYHFMEISFFNFSLTIEIEHK